MSGEPSPPLRLSRYLSRLVWLSLLPSLGLALWLAADLLDSRQAADQHHALDLAKGVALMIDQHLSARIGGLTILAASPRIDREESWPEVYREAQAFERHFGSHVILATVNEPMRMLLNTRVPFGQALTPLPKFSGRRAAVIARDSKIAAVSDLFLGPIAQKPLISIAVPVLRADTASYLLLTVIEARSFQPLLERTNLPADWTIALRDSEGKLIAQYGPAEDETSPKTHIHFTGQSTLAPWSITVTVPLTVYRHSQIMLILAFMVGITAVTLLGAVAGLTTGRHLTATIHWLATPSGDSPPPLRIAEILDARHLIDESNRRMRESEARFRCLFQRSPVPMAYIERPSGRVTFNSRFRQVFGYRESDIPTLEQWWPQAYPDPQNRAQACAAWDRALERGGAAEEDFETREYQITCKDGSERQVDLARIVLPEGILVSFHDITERHAAERKQAERQAAALDAQKQARLAALNQMQDANAARQVAEAAHQALCLHRERLQLMLDHAPVSLALFDREMRYLAVSRRWLNEYGPSGEEVIGRAHYDLFPEIGENWKAIHRRALAGEIVRANEDCFIRADGREQWLRWEVRPWSLPEGGIGGIVIFSEDISERRQAEDQRHRMAEALRQAAQPLVMTDSETRILYANPAFLTLLGYNEAEIVGRTVRQLALPDPSSQAQPQEIIRAVREQGSWSGDLIRITKAGLPIPVLVTVAEVRDLIGRSTGFVASYLDISEQKRVQAALEKERGLLRALVQTIPDPVWLTDTEGRYLNCNHAFERLLGRPEAQITGRNEHEFRPPTTAETEPARECLALARPVVQEEWVRFADNGQRALLETITTPMLGSDGTIIGVLGIGRDITRRHHSEEALRESEERFRTYVETSPLAIFVTNADGCYIDINPAAELMLGWSRNEIISRHLLDLAPEEERERVRRDFTALSQGEKVAGDYRLIAAGQREVWVSLAAVRISADRLAAFCLDITARKAIEAELDLYRQGLEEAVTERTADLERTEAQLRLILESTADGLYGVDLAGRISFINPGACAILGYPPEQMIGRESHTILHHTHPDGRPYPRSDCPVEATLRQGLVQRVEDEVYWAADQRAIPVSYSSHPMIRQGQIIGAVVSFTDISARKAADAARTLALEEAERLATLRREFLANMSHEIRTPLSAILGLAQIGERREGSDEGKRFFNRILEAGQDLQDLIDEILDFSKIESGKMTVETIPMTLGEVIDRAVGIFALRAQAKPLRFTITEESALPGRCLGDPNRLRQSLVNLLGNAIKFTPPAGSVTLNVTSSSGALVFTIEDTGIGIEAEAVGRLFNPFEQADGSTTRRYGGTGLGLSISRDLVNLMGGQISLTSIPNQGSRFTLSLPLAGAEPPAPWPEREIAVLGLPEEEVSVLEQVAPRVRRLPAPLCPETVALLVIDHHALTEPRVVDLAGERLRRGKTVAVVVDPGGREALPPDCARAIPIERPFRPRHLKMLLNAIPDQPAAAKRSRRLAGVRILGAEDNDVNRLVLEDMVSLEGGSLSCFENGRYAFEHLQQSGRASFDLVLTDIQMPEMDGYALARAIHDWAPDLPVIALTAHAMGEERDRCLAAGMVDHVVKPVRLETLVTTVLHHSPPRPETMDLDPAQLLAHYAGRRDFAP